MSFDAEALRAARHQLEKLGRAAVYLYGAEEPIETLAIVASTVVQFPNEDGRVASGMRDEAYLKLEDVPRPRRGAEITLPATDDMPVAAYKVDTILDRDGYVARLLVYRVEVGS